MRWPAVAPPCPRFTTTLSSHAKARPCTSSEAPCLQRLSLWVGRWIRARDVGSDVADPRLGVTSLGDPKSSVLRGRQPPQATQPRVSTEAPCLHPLSLRVARWIRAQDVGSDVAGPALEDTRPGLGDPRFGVLQGRPSHWRPPQAMRPSNSWFLGLLPSVEFMIVTETNTKWYISGLNSGCWNQQNLMPFVLSKIVRFQHSNRHSDPKKKHSNRRPTLQKESTT